MQALVSNAILVHVLGLLAMRSGRSLHVLRRLSDSFHSLVHNEKLAMIDVLSNKIIERFPNCVDLLTARGQAYLALDMPLYAAIDGLMGISLNSSDVTSHILDIDSLLSMQKFDAARDKARWLNSSPIKEFHDVLRESRVEEKIAQKEKELLEVRFLLDFNSPSYL